MLSLSYFPQRQGDRFSIGGPCRSRDVSRAYDGIETRQLTFPAAVGRGNHQVPQILVGGSAQISDLLSIRREGDAGINILHQLRTGSSQGSHFVQVGIVQGLLVGADEIEVVAVGRETQSVEGNLLWRDDLHIASRCYLPHPETL